MPVLPLVGSTIVPPGLSTPRRSASSTMATAMRSLTLPAGLCDSIFATTTAPPGRGKRLSRTIGVRPTSSSTDPAIVVISPPSVIELDVVHRAGGGPALCRLRLELAERELINHLRHGVADAAPELRQVVGVPVAGAR